MRRKAAAEPDPWDAPDPALAVALDELRWYRRNANRARQGNHVTEVLLLLASAATTVVAALGVTAWVTALLAATALVLTGLRRSFDWHENWVAYISKWSELRTVVHQYQLLPEERRDDEARRELVSNVDDIVSTETERWASRRRRMRDHTAHEGMP